MHSFQKTVWCLDWLNNAPPSRFPKGFYPSPRRDERSTRLLWAPSVKALAPFHSTRKSTSVGRVWFKHGFKMFCLQCSICMKIDSCTWKELCDWGESWDVLSNLAACSLLCPAAWRLSILPQRTQLKPEVSWPLSSDWWRLGGNTRRHSHTFKSVAKRRSNKRMSHTQAEKLDWEIATHFYYYCSDHSSSRKVVVEATYSSRIRTGGAASRTSIRSTSASVSHKQPWQVLRLLLFDWGDPTAPPLLQDCRPFSIF